jgi:preprotein translocase subunit SecG
MYQFLMIIHVLVAMTLIGLVLIQQGKGADIGAGLGTGASNTIFGSQGTGRFLVKLTGGLALAFFVTSLLLSSLLASQYHAANQISMPVVDLVRKAELNIPIPAEGLPNEVKE